MKHSLVAIALSAALALPQSALVEAAQTPAVSAQTQAAKGYLGITIDRLPESIRAQLPNTIPPEQGVLVAQVIQGSPAEKAGLRPYDILLQYNDQKLYAPEQLTRLVGAATSGQTAKLEIVRGGKLSTVTVTLGKSQLAPTAEWFPGREQPALPPLRYHRPRLLAPHQQAQADNEANWGSFDALSLEKVKGKEYKATIAFLGKDGSHKRFEFRGTRDQIRKKIRAQKDLPNLERRQLLQALTSENQLFPDAYWPFVPSQQDFPHTAPWWAWRPDF
jgi:membrane-associated protease RseP (regulator of RpoE activity)